MFILIITTLHDLLYPPLKGFSQIQDQDIRVSISNLSLPQSSSKGISSNLLDIVVFNIMLHQKGVDL